MSGEMFDLKNDPHEMNNLYGKLAYAERQEKVHHLARFFKSTL